MFKSLPHYYQTPTQLTNSISTKPFNSCQSKPRPLYYSLSKSHTIISAKESFPNLKLFQYKTGKKQLTILTKLILIAKVTACFLTTRLIQFTQYSL
jgi:hypothetical protein